MEKCELVTLESGVQFSVSAPIFIRGKLYERSLLVLSKSCKNETFIEFSWEFDTYLHTKCLINTLKKNPTHEEAVIIARELGFN